MNVSDYWTELFELNSYEPAPKGQAIRACNAILEALFGLGAHPLVPGPEGPCDDRCSAVGARLRVGRVMVCPPCAYRRASAMRRAAA